MATESSLLSKNTRRHVTDDELSRLCRIYKFLSHLSHTHSGIYANYAI